MATGSSKMSKIKELIDSFYQTTRTRPLAFGTIEDIEANYYVIDHIDLIIKYREVDYEELSWQAFLFYKGLGNMSASDVIKREVSKAPYEELNRLREEYLQWRDAKISSLKNSEKNPLLDMLSKADENQANRLTTWFIKHPSRNAILLYKTRIKNQYSKYEAITLFLSSMGDKSVLDWAMKNVNNIKKRCLALKIISATPAGDSGNVIRNIIHTQHTEDIISVMEGYSYSANSNNVFDVIEKVIEDMDFSPLLHFSIIRALSGPIHSGKKKAAILRERLALQKERSVGQPPT